MKLSRWEEIAISILVTCARNDQMVIRTEVAARVARASKDQAARVVLALRGAGFIETIRGARGGIRLAYPAEDVTLGDILRQVGSRIRTQQFDIVVKSPIDEIMRAAMLIAHDIYANVTIADLARGEIEGSIPCLECPIRLGASVRRANQNDEIQRGW